MKWLRYGGLGLVLAGVGCGNGQEDIPDNEPVQTEARLQSFDKCEDLEAYVENTAVLDMRAQLKWQKQMIGNWGRGGPVYSVEDGSIPPTSPTPSPAAGDSAAPGTGTQGPDDYTETNNQVAGVDEADFVKNDGTRIFVISGRKLYLHRSWPAASLSAVGSLQLEGWPREMFLQDNRVVIFSQVSLSQESSGEMAPCIDGGCYYYGLSATKVTVVDVSNMASPQVQDELFLPGSYANARSADGSVRLLLNDSFRWPEGVRFWPEYEQGLWEDKGRLKKKLDELIVQNEQIIRGKTLKDWLPTGWRKRPDGSRVEVGYDCRDFYRSNTPAKLGFVTVASLNLDPAVEQTMVRRTSLVTDPGEVYATPDSLYLASQHWWWWPKDGQKDYTYLHKFDIRDPGVARYVGSGTVEGHLLNQFSMDEHQGVLRVATTITTYKDDDYGNPWGRQETTNRLFTFRAQDGKLVKAGQSDELAKGERIFSARFLGNKGYVVTFRQVDPLFTFDLSDPEHPRKVGELKVPGFSSYIHPLDENHLLTIGEYVPENSNDWRQRAVKLSLFDVTDLAHPREAFTQLVGNAYGWSEALWEHKAFNFFPAKGLLAIPFSDYDPNGSDYWNSFRSELRVFRVDAATGFSSVGTVSMTDLYRARSYKNWTWYWMPTVRRSVMADDYVYAITDAGVRVAHVSNLQAPLATATFEPDFSLPYYP